MKDPKQTLEEEYGQVLEDFFNPLLPGKPILEDRLGGCDTAYFDFTTNRTHVSRKFLEQLCTTGGLDERTAANGICKHEIGHYVEYPRELSTLLFITYLAEKNFPKHKKAIVGYWLDVKDNMPQLLKKERGKEIRALYRAMNKLVEAELSEEERKYRRT